MKQSSQSITRLVTRLCAALALFVAVVPVAFYSVSVYFTVTASLDSNLRVQSVAMERVILDQPDYWDLNSARLEASYQRFVVPDQRYRILNREGEIVAEGGPDPAWHFLTRSVGLYDSGREVGRVEASASVYRAVQIGLLLLGISFGLALIIWLPVRRLPLRALHAAQAVIEQHHAHLETIVASRTREADLARAVAEEANRAKSEFLSSMSHELRTPLNGVLGFAQLIALEDEFPQEARESAQKIVSAGNHLLALISDLIDLSRIEADKLQLSIEPVSVSAVVEASIRLVAPLAAKRGIQINDVVTARLGSTRRPACVKADSARIRQVLINLLANAIKYNRAQGHVTVSSQTENGRVRISIADNGLGIPSHKQDRLFNAFDRLGRESGPIEGSGIGLVLSQRIVLMMNGQIGFTSVEGQGSTFWIDLPACNNAEVLHLTNGTPSYQEAATELVSDTSGVDETGLKRVLYMEDNPMNLHLMRSVFSKRPGVKLIDALTAEIGLELARASKNLALILLDINLPGMDGYAAMKILKANQETADIPVIAITANAMKGDRERGEAAGFVDYQTKPFKISALNAVLDKILKQGNRAMS